MRGIAALIPTIFVACVLLSGCGGGSQPVPGGSPASRAQRTIGDVSVATEPIGASAIAYDPDDKIVLFGSGSTVLSATNLVAPIRLPASDAGSITGLAYSASQHAVYFSSATAIYRATLGGNVAPLAQGFQSINALAVDDNGTPYAVESDRVSTIVGGKATPITAPGSIGNPFSANLVTIPNVNFQPPNFAQITYDRRDGAFYVTDGGVVKRVTTTGAISILAGPCGVYPSAVQPACPTPNAGVNSMQFGVLAGITYDDSSGMLYVSDVQNNNLWTLTPGGTATVVAGYGPPGNANGNGQRALLDSPFLLASASDQGLVYIEEHAQAGTAAFALASYATTGLPAPPYEAPVLTFSTATRGRLLASLPFSGDIAVASDGTAWITETASNKIAHVTLGGISEFDLPAAFNSPGGIAVDPNNDVWFLAIDQATRGRGLIRFGRDGTQTPVLSGSSAPFNITCLTVGPDGNPWFGASDGTSTFLGFVDTKSSKVTLNTISATSQSGTPVALISGPDGNLWFSVTTYNVPSPIFHNPGNLLPPGSTGNTAIQRMTVGGVVLPGIFPTAESAATEFAATKSGQSVSYINDFSDTLWSMTSSGAESARPLATQCNACRFAPVIAGVTAAPDGSIWLTEAGTDDLVRIDPSGALSRYLVPQISPGLGRIASRADGKIWVAGYASVFLLDPQTYDREHLPHPTPQ